MKKSLSIILAVIFVFSSVYAGLGEINFNGLFSVEAKAVDSNAADNTIFEYNGHFYQIFDEVMTWDEANSYCEYVGGHLATITSEDENNFLYSVVKSSGYNSAYFGFTDVETEGTWKWVTNEKVTYTNWHVGEPNRQNTKEDYAMFYLKYNDGTWNDGDFVYKTGNVGTVFICEWDSVSQLQLPTPKVTTSNEIGGVNVTWNKVAGATKYVVFRRQAGSNSWVAVGTTTSTALLDKNVKSGVYYVYSVRAYNASGEYSVFDQTKTQNRKYMATPKLTTIYNHVNGLAIKWNAVAGITNGYRVYRRGAGSTYWTYLGTTKNLYFIDNGVKSASGSYYRYTVIADGGYHSKFDTTGLYLKRLANPALISAASSSSGITIRWSAIMGTTGYYVYRKTANTSWVRVGAVGGTNNTTFLDKTAKKGVTYIYTVRAVYGSTTSAYNSGISCYDRY